MVWRYKRHANRTKIEHAEECAYIRPIFSIQFLSDLLFIPDHHCPVQSRMFLFTCFIISYRRLQD